MGEEIGRERVVVPHKTGLEVVAYGVERDARIGGVGNPTVVAKHQRVDTGSLYRRQPRAPLGCEGKLRADRVGVCLAVVEVGKPRREGPLCGTPPVHCHARLHYELLLVEPSGAVVARVAVAQGGECSERGADAILGVEVCL